MIKECKNEAKVLFKNNYKVFLFPAILLMVFNALSQIFLKEYIIVLSSMDRYIMLFVYLSLSLLAVPLVKVKLFKVSISSINKENNANCTSGKFNIKNIIQIFLINLVPIGFMTIYSIGKSINTNYFKSELFSIVLIILNLFVFFLVNYKFFICNFLATNFGNALDNIKLSFSVMRNIFGKYVLLMFSFLHWELLVALIYVVLLMLYGEFDNVNTYLSILLSFGYGIYFYLIPYKYSTYSIFINKLLKDHPSKNLNS